jgi:hypothetical protein
MRSLGHAGCVTARGWDAIHLLGSANISLKLFSIANVGQAATGLKLLNPVNEDGFVISDSLKELSDMMEVKTALQNLCMAAQLAAPWNFLYLVIDSFLKSTTNMEADMASYKKVPIVAAFIDHVLQVNAANWVCDSDFLDMPALKALWESWLCARKGAWKAKTTAAAGSTASGSTNMRASAAVAAPRHRAGTGPHAGWWSGYPLPDAPPPGWPLRELCSGVRAAPDFSPRCSPRLFSSRARRHSVSIGWLISSESGMSAKVGNLSLTSPRYCARVGPAPV